MKTSYSPVTGQTPVRALFPRLLHGGDYNPDQWLHAPEVIEEDFRLMRLAGCNTFSVGIFAWTSYEKEEGRYGFGWLERIMDRMAAEGHRVFLATPSGARPAWLAQKYPEVRKVNRDGRREPYRARHNHCWTSPVFRDKVRAVNRELARRFGGHPALLGWHISNEYGGDSEPACYCDLCLARFHAWLKDRYTTLDAMNLAWWGAFWSHQYTAWEQVDPRDGCVDGLALDWRRFQTWQMVDFYNFEKAALREHSAAPCTTNFMGLKQDTDYVRFAAAVDFVADDQYPAYDPQAAGYLDTVCAISFKNDLYRCLKPGTPWMLMESCPDAPQWKHPMKLKRPGLHRAEMLQAVGHGADGTCYFQWRKGRGSCEKLHGAIVDHAGHEHTRVFQGVADLSKLYTRLTPVLGSRVEARIALIHDWEVQWALSCTNGPDLHAADYTAILTSHYRPFHEHGYSVDVVSSEADFSGYKLLLAPLLYMLKPGVAERLQAFVEAGGILVSGYWSGIVNETNLCFTGGWPGGGLRGLFGLWNEETDCLVKDETRAVHVDAEAYAGLHQKVRGSRFCAVVHAEGATVLARYAEDFYSGAPALTENRCGAGRAYYMATQFDRGFLHPFLLGLAHEAGIPAALPGQLPEGVRVQRRTDGSSTWVFVQNFSMDTRYLNTGGLRLDSMEDGSAAASELRLPPLGSGVWRLDGAENG